MPHPFRALISPLQTQCDLVRIAFIIIATKLHTAKDAERGAEIFRVTKKRFPLRRPLFIYPERKAARVCSMKNRGQRTICDKIGAKDGNGVQNCGLRRLKYQKSEFSLQDLTKSSAICKKYPKKLWLYNYNCL